MERWRERTDAYRGTEAKARREAEAHAARLEAMGSVYDVDRGRWSPVRLRINARRGQARRDARDALTLARATGGGSVEHWPMYDERGQLVDGPFWLLYDPGRGHMHLVCQLWDQHAYEALPVGRYRRRGATSPDGECR